MNNVIKKLISSGDVEVLDCIDYKNVHPLLQKIALTRPLSAEEVLRQHGLDVCITYMSICNTVDGEIENEALMKHLVFIKKGPKAPSEKTSIDMKAFLGYHE